LASFSPPPAGALAAASPQDATEGGPWVALEGSRATVYHREGQEGLALTVLRFLDAQRPLPALPSDVPRDVSAYLAPDRATFDALAGGRVPEWSGGVAIPARQQLVLPVFASARALSGDRGRVLRHEWAHLGLHAHLGGLRIPRWFDEGYAEWAAGWDRSEAWRLRLLLARGRTPPLDSLTLDWPRDAASAGAAYLLAATAVEYLVSEGGERGLELLFDRWKRTGSFEAALGATYGVTPGRFEEHWRRYVKERYGWLLVFSHSMVLWLMLALLLVLLFGVRRRHDRERMARLRAGELPDAPDYWTEEGEEGEDDEEEEDTGVSPPGPGDAGRS
jgi:hypothetical protein